MKNGTVGAISGCIFWILLIGMISGCTLPIFIAIGGITSFSQYAVTFTGNFLCPSGTTPEGYTYETTTTDDFGNPEPATVMELHCVDQNGNVVKNDPVIYSFLWMGIFACVGIILSGFLSFLLAAPAGMLVTRFLNRRQKTNISAIMEP